MLATLEHHLNQLIARGDDHLLAHLQHGIEKEGLRVDAFGHLAQTPHPRALGSALTHSEITTDYSEALLEFITPVFQDTGAMLEYLADLHRFNNEVNAEELLWCASMPCNIRSEHEIPVAEYGHSNIGRLKHIYRLGLQHRYGKMMQTIAGIHYNVSLPEQLWPAFQALNQNRDSMRDFRSASYFRMIRNFRRYSWLLLYLFGASPALSRYFMQGKRHQLQSLGADTLYLPHATSLRMSDLGYSNRAQSALQICFNHLDSYVASLQRAIRTSDPLYEELGVLVSGEYRQLNSNILQIENEYYSDIRPKRVTESGEKPIHALQQRGVQYIEVRNTDINPLLPLGISHEQTLFMDAFLVTCLLCNDNLLSDDECRLLNENHQRVVTRGREPGLNLLSQEGERPLTQMAREILQQVGRTAAMLDSVNSTQSYTAAVLAQRDKVDAPELTPSAQVLAALQGSGASHHEWVLEQSRLHRAQLMRQPLGRAVRARLQSEAQASLQEQARQEAQPQPPFAEFLAAYNAS